jgi:hypothetical protein
LRFADFQRRSNCRETSPEVPTSVASNCDPETRLSSRSAFSQHGLGREPLVGDINGHWPRNDKVQECRGFSSAVPPRLAPSRAVPLTRRPFFRHAISPFSVLPDDSGVCLLDLPRRHRQGKLLGWSPCNGPIVAATWTKQTGPDPGQIGKEGKKGNDHCHRTCLLLQFGGCTRIKYPRSCPYLTWTAT